LNLGSIYTTAINKIEYKCDETVTDGWYFDEDQYKKNVNGDKSSI